MRAVRGPSADSWCLSRARCGPLQRGEEGHHLRVPAPSRGHLRRRARSRDPEPDPEEGKRNSAFKSETTVSLCVLVSFNIDQRFTPILTVGCCEFLMAPTGTGARTWVPRESGHLRDGRLKEAPVTHCSPPVLSVPGAVLPVSPGPGSPEPL